MMSTCWEKESGGCATLVRDPAEALRRREKRLVLAGQLPMAGRVADQFRRQGWQVHVLEAGESLNRTIKAIKPNAVVLDAQLGEQSGYLACAKLHRAKPRLPVLIVSSKRSPKAERFAQFVGAAAFVCEGDSPSELLAVISSVLLMAL